MVGERPYTPPAELKQREAQVKQERENRARWEAEMRRWKDTSPQETSRIVSALIRVIENVPVPGQTETMKAFRARSGAWLASKERETALRRGRGG
jgi:hypothetical protein